LQHLLYFIRIGYYKPGKFFRFEIMAQNLQELTHTRNNNTMETILSETDSKHLLTRLTDTDKAEIKRDKVRFGEYFIAEEDHRCFRVNPINVVDIEGSLKIVKLSAVTFI